MAEGRMLKKEISKSKKLAKCSPKAQVLWFMMLPHTDIEGRVDACPQIVKGRYLTMFNYTESAIQKYLEELHKARLIVLYQIDGDQYVEYTRFQDFQTLNPNREAESKIPAPTPEDSRVTPEDSPLSKVKISKVKSKEYTSEFEIFWKKYPRGEEKPQAFDEWQKLNPDETLRETLLKAIEQQKRKGCLSDPRYAPYARRWLSKSRWTDEGINSTHESEETRLARVRAKQRKDYTKWVNEQTPDKLHGFLKEYRNYEWLVRELRPEIFD